MTARAGAAAIAAGLAVFGTALLFHPVLADPWAVERGLRAIAGHRGWEAVHWAGAVGLGLWLAGLLAVPRLVAGGSGGGFSPFASGMVVCAMGLWLTAMALEAGAMPGLARAYAAGEKGVLLAARPWYTFGMLVGYVAAGLHWGAVALWGADALLGRGLPRWFGWWGALGGGAALAALPVAVAYPGAAPVLLVATSGTAAAWTLAAAWFLWRER